MRIGLIQTRGLGDIVIAAPIAMYYIERGCEVYWPIDSEFIPSFKSAFPLINFLSIDKKISGDATIEYFYIHPLELLRKHNCESINILYSHLSGIDLPNKRLQESLTFDAYKYAIMHVPFEEKWNFSPKRNPAREANLFKLLNVEQDEEYILIQDTGSNFSTDVNKHLPKNIRVIKISPITECIFDWLSIIENAVSVYVIDSVYANIIEQMNIRIEKNLILRSNSSFTPVFKTNWKFI